MQLQGGFLDAAAARPLQVWYSNLTSGSGMHVNPPDDQLFLKRAPLSVGADGTVSLTVDVGEIYTLTTLTVGGKGTARSPPPAGFPLPFTQTFDDEATSSPPKVWYDQQGAWEVQPSPYNDGHGNVMRQVVPVWPNTWGYSCSGPTSYFGPAAFEGDVTVSFDVRLEAHGAWTLSFGNDGKGCNQPAGFASLTLATNGTWAFGGGGSRLTGSVPFATDTWYSVSVRLTDAWQVASVDGKVLANATASARGWRAKVQMDRYIYASMDNFRILNSTS